MMGNICSVCSGKKEEGTKTTGFQSTSENDTEVDLLLFSDPENNRAADGVGGVLSTATSASSGLHNASGDGHLSSAGGEGGVVSATVGGSEVGGGPSKEEMERMKKLREEQARLELIVQAAGRGMVAVRSTRGSTGYYDQGFAAALAQHLEQTTKFPDHVPIRLPPSHPTVPVYSRLAAPQWEGIRLGSKGGGIGGGGGENRFSMSYMDHVAESFLDTVIPKKQRLFAGSKPIAEQLL